MGALATAPPLAQGRCRRRHCSWLGDYCRKLWNEAAVWYAAVLPDGLLNHRRLADTRRDRRWWYRPSPPALSWIRRCIFAEWL